HPNAPIWSDIQKKFIEESGGRAIIEKKIYNKATILADAVWNNDSVKKLVQLGEPEHPITWHNGVINCKAKLDYYRLKNNSNQASGLIIDYKSSLAADPCSFAKSILAYGYHRQDAMYTDGIEMTYGENPKGVIFIVQEKSLP